MAIRNPLRATDIDLELGTVAYRMEAATSFLDDLAAIRNDANLSNKDKQIALLTAAEAFKQGPAALVDASNLETAVPNFRTLYLWIQAHSSSLVAGELEAAWPEIAPLINGAKQGLWDNLIALLIAGGSSSLREGIMEVLMADHFLGQYGSAEGILDEEAILTLSKATLVLPASVFPLPKLEVVEAAEEPPFKESAETIEAHLRWVAINKLMPALVAEYGRLLHYWRKKGQEPIVEVDGESVSSFKGILLEEAFVLSLPTDEQDILSRLGLVLGDELDYVQEAVQNEALRLGGVVEEGATPGKRVVVYAGAIWNVDGPYDEAAMGMKQKGETDTSPQWNDFNAKLEPGNTCGVRPMGVADLKKVEQKLCCYAPGEVAHIENILQGEYKERSTRRLKRREETFVSVTEREKMDERDSITTERFEMNKETSEVIQQDTSFTLGVSVSSLGPVTAMMNSQFGTSTSTTQSDALSTTYAKDVTERALQRITEKVREEHYLTLIEEYEENNKHGLDNRAGTKHVVGLYRWADKIYEAKVVNYGKRLMMEFMIPEPAYFHTWAMSQPDTTTTTTLVDPFHPSSVEAQQSLGLPAALKKPDDLHPWNYSRWAAAYGAKVSPAPR